MVDNPGYFNLKNINKVKSIILFRQIIVGSLIVGLSSCFKGDFIISSSIEVADIVVTEDGIVQIAAQMFAKDVERISGREPKIVSESESDFQIKAGTLGLNDDFDKLCKQINSRRQPEQTDSFDSWKRCSWYNLRLDGAQQNDRCFSVVLVGRC